MKWRAINVSKEVAQDERRQRFPNVGSATPGGILALVDRDRTQEHHGSGMLERVRRRPVRATGCLMPDGTATDARCLTRWKTPADETDHVWQQPMCPGRRVTRRGRVTIEPGVALRFVDAPDADDGIHEPPSPCLERDLAGSPRVRALLQSDVLAQLFYGALCNTRWRHGASDYESPCSWRSAGGVVAHLVG